MSPPLAAHLTQIYHTWDDFKANLTSCTGVLRRHETSILITAYFYDTPEVHICQLWKGDVPDGVDAGANTSALADFEANFRTLAEQRRALDLTDDLGRKAVVAEPRTGTEVIYSSGNFCDPSTWFGGSVRVTEQSLTDSGNGLTWTSPDTQWVDLISGRVQDDDGLVEEQQFTTPGNPHGYQVSVWVDDVLVTMREPFEASGGDYEVLWTEGQVRFFTSQAGKAVKASYSKANESTFYLRPLRGKALSIEAAESDFSEDCIPTDTIIYAVFGWVEAFAPQYAYTPGVGTASFTNGNTAVTGAGTSFLSEVTPGNYVRLEAHGPENYMVVASVESNTALTLAAPYTGATGTGSMAISMLPTGVYPYGTKIELKRGQYKRITQIFNEAIGSYPQVTILASTAADRANLSVAEFRRTCRGLRSPIQSTPFRYATTRDLRADMGMELRVWLKHHRAFDGFFSSMTLYCTSRSL